MIGRRFAINAEAEVPTGSALVGGPPYYYNYGNGIGGRADCYFTVPAGVTKLRVSPKLTMPDYFAGKTSSPPNIVAVTPNAYYQLYYDSGADILYVTKISVSYINGVNIADILLADVNTNDISTIGKPFLFEWSPAINAMTATVTVQ